MASCVLRPKSASSGIHVSLRRSPKALAMLKITESRNADSQPPAPGGPLARHLIVDVVEERLELTAGERPLGALVPVVLQTGSGVPLVHDLDGVSAKPGDALLGPVVSRVGHVRAERPDRVLVAAQLSSA
jgi:hypothetical protein